MTPQQWARGAQKRGIKMISLARSLRGIQMGRGGCIPHSEVRVQRNPPTHSYPTYLGRSTSWLLFHCTHKTLPLNRGGDDQDMHGKKYMTPLAPCGTVVKGGLAAVSFRVHAWWLGSGNEIFYLRTGKKIRVRKKGGNGGKIKWWPQESANKNAIKNAVGKTCKKYALSWDTNRSTITCTAKMQCANTHHIKHFCEANCTLLTRLEFKRRCNSLLGILMKINSFICWVMSEIFQQSHVFEIRFPWEG